MSSRLGLERAVDAASTQRNFDVLDRLVPENGGRGVRERSGVTSVSTSGATTGSASVTHGMGSTPVTVVATAMNSTGGLTNVCVDTVGATAFNVSVKFTDGVARTTTITVGWIARG